MYCPSCGNDIAVELKYCNRCGANLSVPVPGSSTTVIAAPVKLTVPSIVMGLTIIGGLGIIFASASQLALVGVHPFAILWIVLFGAATLFGCTALMIRFWTKLLTLQRETIQAAPVRPSLFEKHPVQHLPPRLEPVPSVTENTTRTFTPIYREPSDR
jgi:hypothetical protein